MAEDFLSFDPPNHFPDLQGRAVPELPELDLDQSTVTESDDEDDVFETDDEDDDSETDYEDDDSESDGLDDDFESEDDSYDSGYEAGSYFESDDEDSDDEAEGGDQDFESDHEADGAHSFTSETQPVQGNSADPNHRSTAADVEYDFIKFEIIRSYVRHLPTDEEAALLPIGEKEVVSALRRSSFKLRLLSLELDLHQARTAVRTAPAVRGVSHSDVHPAPVGFVVDVSHLEDVHNNDMLPSKPAAMSPLAGRQNELVRCAVSFRWWLTGRQHAAYSLPLFLYVAACDSVAVLAGAALCAALRVVAKALCKPGTLTPPLSDFPLAWLAHAPVITVVSVALDSVAAREWERVMRAQGCRVGASLPIFQLRRRWAGARRRFVNVSFSLFAALWLVRAAVDRFCIAAAV